MEQRENGVREEGNWTRKPLAEFNHHKHREPTSNRLRREPKQRKYEILYILREILRVYRMKAGSRDSLHQQDHA